MERRNFLRNLASLPLAVVAGSSLGLAAEKLTGETLKNTPTPRKPKRTITFVSAPDIPLSEVAALEAHMRQAMRDPEYKVVTNYDVHVQTIELYEGAYLIVRAEDATPAEVIALRRFVDNHDLVVRNYKMVVGAYHAHDPGDSPVTIIACSRNYWSEYSGQRPILFGA